MNNEIKNSGNILMEYNELKKLEVTSQTEVIGTSGGGFISIGCCQKV